MCKLAPQFVPYLGGPAGFAPAGPFTAAAGAVAALHALQHPTWSWIAGSRATLDVAGPGGWVTGVAMGAVVTAMSVRVCGESSRARTALLAWLLLRS